MSLIITKNITKEYHTGEIVTPVLNGISLEIKEQEFVSIIGHSGSGKSTLLHILGFLDRQTGGTYSFEGKNVEDYSDNELAEIRNIKAGFIFQAFNLLPRMTALENVCLPLVYAGVPKEEELKRGTEALVHVGLSHRLNHRPNQLSGGEQQRVAIARALINNPKIILADEPTGNLDSKSTMEVMKIFQKLNHDGHTIIIVTHEHDITTLTKRSIVIKDGRIIEDIAAKNHSLI